MHIPPYTYIYMYIRTCIHAYITYIYVCVHTLYTYSTLHTYAQDGARNVLPLIVHVTHFYYYKSI